MTLVGVPARILATVTTAGSKASTRRVTMACRLLTISQAIGIGSAAWWGMDAWPPRPRTVMRNSSADAMIDRPLLAIIPDGMLGDWWRSEEHTSELQSLMRISYAVFCLQKKTTTSN